jgi:hypothetical protein
LPSHLFAFLLLLGLPALARADARPDFDDDAKPILRAQPHLLEYIKANFKVEETGYARVPGTDDRPPQPPYIFRARHRGESGPDHITLLIQPGPPGHILLVKEDTPGAAPTPPSPGYAPEPGQQEPPPSENQPITSAPAPQEPAPPQPAEQPAPAQSPEPIGSSPPTSATPSGPIQDSNSSSPNGGSLAPPPDPAPAN